MVVMPKLPKVFSINNLKRKAPFILDDGDVIFTLSEKLDGSQWRVYIGKDEWDVGSKNVWGKDSVDKRMFGLALQRTAELYERWPFDEYGEMWLYMEYLKDSKHNVVKYDRVPKNNLYLFAAKKLDENRWLTEHELVQLARVIDVEPPNILGAVNKLDEELFKKIIDFGSILGGKMEGIVLTTYKYDSGEIWGVPNWYGFPLKAKYVSDEFKEVADVMWSKSRKSVRKNGIVTIGDFVSMLLDKYITEPRLMKVRMQMQERGEYTGTDRDIGTAIRTYWEDLKEEEYNNIVNDIVSVIMKKFRQRMGRRIATMIKDGNW